MSKLFSGENGQDGRASTDGQRSAKTGGRGIGETTNVVVVSVDHTGRRVNLDEREENEDEDEDSEVRTNRFPGALSMIVNVISLLNALFT